MSTKLQIPPAQEPIGGGIVLSPVWYRAMRAIFDRVGGYEALTPQELAALIDAINLDIDAIQAEIAALEADIAAIDTTVSGHTATINDHETRIDALEGGGGGSVATYETGLDFGSKPVWDASFTVSEPSVSPTSKILVFPSANPALGRHSDDWQWDGLTLSAVAGTGEFTVYANASGPIEGVRKIYYQVI